jgi:putative hemolysin
MKSKLYIVGLTLILSAVIVSGCGTTTAEPTIGLANPAAVYCEEQGYTLEMRTDADGGQHSVCIFPDGSECEEWAFYRGECSLGSLIAEQPTETPTPAPTETATAQPTETPVPVEPAETWVYVDLMPDESGTTLTWIDNLSGAANSVPAPGTRYQVVGEWVYYQEGNGTVHRVNAAGQDERFDFMGIPESNWEAMDWAVSPDGTQIVWMRSLFETGEGYDITLTSELYVATIATGEARLLTTHVVHEHQTLTPWGFSPDGSQVFVYLQPYGIGGLFLACGEFSVLDVATGQLTPLPDPMGGAAALSDDGTRLARFGYTEGEGFKVNLTDLASGQTTEITTPSTDLGFVQVGEGVFSPDNSTLVYTVAYGDWGSEGFALVQVDFTTGTQQELLASQPTHYKVAHFEDDGSLLLTIAWPGEGTGAFRLYPDGTLERLSEATFVGISQ